MPALLTADWCPLGKDEYFRKFEIYSMPWHNEINMDSVDIAAAPYGGPVAVIRDRKKFVKVQGSGKPIILIYTASGKLISSIVWSSGPIIQLGWSSTEDLLCIQNDGHVLIYDMFGTYQHTFSMGQEAKDTNIIEAKIFSSLHGTGLAVLTTSYRFFLVNNVREPRLRQLAEVPGLTIPPSSWTVISEDRQTQALVAKEREIYIVKPSETHATAVIPEFRENVTSIVEMAVSCDHRHVALFTDHGYLWIGSADLRRKYCEFDTKCPSRPKQLVWCGSKAVIGHWDSILLVVSRQGDFINYTSDCTVHMVPEIDGVRILSSFSHEMIQKVPLVVQQIFRINSTEPGSYLLEASKQFQKHNHRADEYMRLVKDQLGTAVNQCIEAAGYEFDTENQKMLMRAAQYGKSFIPNIDPEAYVKMIRTLRVMNSVRDSKIGIPITFFQLQHLTFQVLLDRLVARRQFPLAIEITKYLKLPDVEGSSRILAHWACYKVKQTHLDQEQVARDIAKKLGYAPGVSYSEIAKIASESGRKQLAIKLIDYEPRASLQVPLLLKLGEDQSALVKAITSGNTDLIFTVLLHLRENMPLAEFQMSIRNFPLAQSLYVKYCKNHNKETLRDIYSQEDDHNALAAIHVQESFDPKNSSTRVASLEAAKECFKHARNDFAASLCEEQQKLLKHQRNLEDKFNREFVGLSVNDTVKLLLQIHEVKLADKMRVEYKVPDRMYWWFRILVLAEQSDWAEMDKFSKTKKSPIGFEPFIDMCLEYGNKVEALKYLPRVRDDLKVKYLVKLGMFEEAAKTAFEQKDIQSLLFVQGKCMTSDTSLVSKITEMISQLRSKK